MEKAILIFILMAFVFMFGFVCGCLMFAIFIDRDMSGYYRRR